MEAKSVLAALEAEMNKSGFSSRIDRDLKVFQTMIPEGESSWSHTAKVRMDNSRRLCVTGDVGITSAVYRLVCQSYADYLPIDLVLSLEQGGYSFNDNKDPLLKTKTFAFFAGIKPKCVFRSLWISGYGKIAAPNHVFTLLVIEELSSLVTRVINAYQDANDGENMSGIVSTIMLHLEYYADLAVTTSGKYGKNYLAVAPVSDSGESLQVYGQTAFIEALSDVFNIEGAMIDLGVTVEGGQLV